MIAEYFGSLPGIDLIGIAGLLISIIIFLLIVIRTLRAERSFLLHMSRLPLDPDEDIKRHTTGR
jgi:hypothetical protein